MPEHWVELVQTLERVPDIPKRAPETVGNRLNVCFRVRKELVKRRIKQSNRDRQPVHRTKDSLEVTSLHGQQLRQCLFTTSDIGGQNHLSHDENPRRLKEHVLGSAEPNAFRTEGTRDFRVLRSVGVRANTQLSHLVGPLHEFGKRAAQFWQHRRGLTEHDLTGRTVQRQDVAFANDIVANAHHALFVVDRQRATARDATFAHTPRNNRRVRRHAALRSQDAFGRIHPNDVFGGGLDANEDDLRATLCLRLRTLCREDDFTDRCPWRCGQTSRDDRRSL